MNTKQGATEIVRRSCPTCEASCGLLVEVDQQKKQIVSVHGDPDDHRTNTFPSAVCLDADCFRIVDYDLEHRGLLLLLGKKTY